MLYSGDDLYDLHVHTIASDGLRSVLELANLARRTGLKGFAITDHDALPDPDVSQMGKSFGLRVIAGIELSTEYNGGGVHVLGLFVDPTHDELREACAKIQKARLDRFQWFKSELSKQRVKLSDPPKQHSIRSLGRLHLARELVRQRCSGSLRSAFERYLMPLSPAAPLARISITEGVRLIRSAGGVAVLAHPSNRWSDHDWSHFREIGIRAAEVRFPRCQAKTRKSLSEKVLELGWSPSAGSDYHGDDHRQSLGAENVTHQELTHLESLSDSTKRTDVSIPATS